MGPPDRHTDPAAVPAYQTHHGWDSVSVNLGTLENNVLRTKKEMVGYTGCYPRLDDWAWPAAVESKRFRCLMTTCPRHIRLGKK